MASSIIEFFVRRLPWFWGVAIIAAATGYFLFIQGFMQNEENEIVRSAWDLQKQFFVSTETVRQALLPEPGKFLKLVSVLALDIPIAILIASALATLMGWAVRLTDLENSRWRLLIVLPLAYGAFDLLEDAALVLGLAFSGSAEILAVIFIPLKMLTLIISEVMSGVFLVMATIFWFRKKTRGV